MVFTAPILTKFRMTQWQAQRNLLRLISLKWPGSVEIYAYEYIFALKQGMNITENIFTQLGLV